MSPITPCRATARLTGKLKWVFPKAGGHDRRLWAHSGRPTYAHSRPQAEVDSALPGFPIADMLNVIDTVTFTGADFSIQHDGVCRMNPELARRVAQLASERCEASDR